MGHARDPNAGLQPSLRSATAAAHHALDHHPLLQRLIRSDLTRAQYAQSLAALHRPHALLERRVHASCHHAGSGLRLSSRLDLLEADLLELGRPVPIGPAPVAGPDPDPVDGRAAWWGRVYVLEGSRLGGAFIARRVHASLGATVPTRFLGTGMALGDHGVLQALAGHALAAPGDLEAAIASARAAFAAYQADLDGFGHAGAPATAGRCP